MEKKSQKLYSTNYNLLMVQDLWQAHYQILLIILPKKFIELNVKMNIIIKNAKGVKLNSNIVTVFLQNLEIN